VVEARGHLAIEVEPRPTGWAVALNGELESSTVDILNERMRELFSTGVRDLTVDAAELEFCDSVGIGCLVTLRDQCEREGCTFRIENTQSYMRRVLLLTGLTEYLNAE
jgi:anti-sigma B factor antagonist